MPVYEYECGKCGGRVEEIQKFSDPPPKKHDGCGGRLKRLPSAPAIQFKGSGFYITDYARAGKDGDKKAKEPEAKSKTEPKSESKTGDDSKAAKPAAETTGKK